MTGRILLIDDDPILAGLLQLTLQLEGYEVIIAPDGAEGLARITAERFDIILLDLVMPNVDGMKFLRIVAERGLYHPPVIIVSSAIEEKLTPAFSDLGVVDIARKPVEPAALVRRVKRVLGAAETAERKA